MNVRPDINKLSKEATAWRRAMHANPGIAYEETFAGYLIREKLKMWNIEHEGGWGYCDGVGGHGIVATIHGNKGPGDTIGFRADMDALPIMEATGLKWSSQNPGLMHACGHDGHTAVLLTVARHLSLNPNFRGTLKLIFQPAEEGRQGAKAMLNEELLKRHPISAVFAMHNAPHLPLGQIAVADREAMASSSYFDIEITGKSAHAALPNEAIDASALAALIRVSLPQTQQNVPVAQRRGVAIGNMWAGQIGVKTIIPGSAGMQGTIRTYNPEVEARIRVEIQETVTRITRNIGGSATVTFRDGSPATINCPKEAAIVRAVAEGMVGTQNTIWNPDPPLFAEDFGFMLAELPGCYFMVGQGDPKNQDSRHNRPLHNDGYDFNDEAIGPAAEFFVRLAEQRLG